MPITLTFLLPCIIMTNLLAYGGSEVAEHETRRKSWTLKAKLS